MLRKIGLLVLVAFLTAAAAAAPVRVGDAYTIKLKQSEQGAVTNHTKNENEKTSSKLEGPDGKVLNEKKEDKIVIEDYKETLVEKEKDKRATRIRREYKKAVVKTGDKETPMLYNGKTVVIEKKDDKYHFTIEGGPELKGKSAEYLNRSFNKDNKADEDNKELEKAFLPKKPIAVNGTWQLDTDEIIKILEKDTKQPFPIDKSKASGKGKLLRAYKKEGRQYGVFEIDISLPLKGEIALGKEVKAPIQSGSKMVMQAKVDACIDGASSDSDSDVSMDIDMVATFTGPDGKEYKMTIAVKQKSNDTEKDLGKK